jgi:hypothetical protein
VVFVLNDELAREFFIPCPNSRHTQRYCAKAECRKASKAAAQAKWLNKPENRSYFRGPENTERVRRWRERHPGYWRKKRSSPDALQDLASVQVPLLAGVVSLLIGDALQDRFATFTRELVDRGKRVLATGR